MSRLEETRFYATGVFYLSLWKDLLWYINPWKARRIAHLLQDRTAANMQKLVVSVQTPSKSGHLFIPLAHLRSEYLHLYFPGRLFLTAALKRQHSISEYTKTQKTSLSFSVSVYKTMLLIYCSVQIRVPSNGILKQYIFQRFH